jgi:cyanophycinase
MPKTAANRHHLAGYAWLTMNNSDHYGTLALVGGDEFGPHCSFDTELLARSGARRVTLLPTAATYERPEHAIANGTSYLTGLGVEVEVIELYSRSDAHNDAIVNQIANAKFLYCIGGSPLHLRSVLIDTPALSAISSAWANGTTIVASSASAMVLGDPMIDPRGGALTIGLGVIEHLAVLPHADQRSQAIRERTIHLVHTPTVMVEIDAQTALVYDAAHGLEVLGQGGVGAYQDASPVELTVVTSLLQRRQNPTS